MAQGAQDVTISQREARRLKKRVEDLERERRQQVAAWTRDYPTGVNIETISLNDVEQATCNTAAILGHALVAKMSGTNLLIYAVAVPKE
jgi:hypothetical protein